MWNVGGNIVTDLDESKTVRCSSTLNCHGVETGVLYMENKTLDTKETTVLFLIDTYNQVMGVFNLSHPLDSNHPGVNWLPSILDYLFTREEKRELVYRDSVIKYSKEIIRIF